MRGKKRIVFKGTTIKLTSGFSTLFSLIKTRKEQNNIFKMLKEKNNNPSNLYPDKKIEGYNNT